MSVVAAETKSFVDVDLNALTCKCQSCPHCQSVSFVCLECRRVNGQAQLKGKATFCEKCGECFHLACTKTTPLKGKQTAWYCDAFGCNEEMRRASICLAAQSESIARIEQKCRERRESPGSMLVFSTEKAQLESALKSTSSSSSSDAPELQTPIAGDTSSSTTPFSFEKPTTNLRNSSSSNPRIASLYKILDKTSKFASTGTGGGMMGELTQKHMQNVVDYLKDNCEFDETSTFCDLGAGLGRPSFHVAIDPGVKYSLGVEICEYPWKMSRVNLCNVVSSGLLPKVNIDFITANSAHFTTLDPCTHLYSFDVGWDPRDLHGLASVFNKSTTIKYLICYHKAVDVIGNYGFLVELMECFPTQMAGSSEVHICYVYRVLSKDEISKMMGDTSSTSAAVAKENKSNIALQRSKMHIHPQHASALTNIPLNVDGENKDDDDDIQSGKQNVTGVIKNFSNIIANMDKYAQPAEWLRVNGELTKDFKKKRGERANALKDAQRKNSQNQIVREQWSEEFARLRREQNKLRAQNKPQWKMVPQMRKMYRQFRGMSVLESEQLKHGEAELITSALDKFATPLESEFKQSTTMSSQFQLPINFTSKRSRSEMTKSNQMTLDVNWKNHSTPREAARLRWDGREAALYRIIRPGNTSKENVEVRSCPAMIGCEEMVGDKSHLYYCDYHRQYTAFAHLPSLRKIKIEDEDNDEEMDDASDLEDFLAPIRKRQAEARERRKNPRVQNRTLAPVMTWQQCKQRAKVSCICGQWEPYDNDMAQCDFCNLWSHIPCVVEYQDYTHDDLDSEDNKFICGTCNPPAKPVSGSIIPYAILREDFDTQQEYERVLKEETERFTELNKAPEWLPNDWTVRIVFNQGDPMQVYDAPDGDTYETRAKVEKHARYLRRSNFAVDLPQKALSDDLPEKLRRQLKQLQPYNNAARNIVKRHKKAHDASMNNIKNYVDNGSAKRKGAAMDTSPLVQDENVQVSSLNNLPASPAGLIKQ